MSTKFTVSNSFFILILLFSISMTSCGGADEEEIPVPNPVPEKPVEKEDERVEGVDYFLPKIDLSNWKVTLPVGSPSEIKPPAILDYATNASLQEFMYNDSTDGSLVFYTYPGSTTANSSYSRTELREQIEPGSNSVNWKFSAGGVMEGELAVTEISKEASGKDHRTIIMQIHGRLTNAQRDLIGEDDNNAPPVLKIYWQNGQVRVKTKVLKNQNVSGNDILKTSSWTDDDGHYFSERVNHGKFKLKVEASYGKLTITLNDSESKVYESVDLEKWDIFENYFKAGNYLQTSNAGSFARVKYYSLDVTH